ncbi:MAG: class I adenylate cyclase [Desulfobacterium sp.]|nr:class I adenylate cyclase [Desulfobacterium sp.]
MGEKDKNGLDLNGFDREWSSADEAGQLDLIKRAAELSPARGIVPILAGIDSCHYSVRNRARMGLNLLKAKAVEIQHLQEHRLYGNLYDSIKESSVFCARIHEVLKPTLPVQEIRIYMEILLESGGRGPFYAWRFCQSGVISIHNMKKVLTTISEQARLALVAQYLRSTPYVRRRFAREFKLILRGISTRKPVILFLAYLFDRNCPSDPILVTLDPALRDPDTLISRELASSDPEERALAVKALAMIAPCMDSGLVQSLLSSREDKIVHRAVLAVIVASPRATYPELCQTLLDRLCTQKGEVLSWFRALVVSTPTPLLGLLDTIRKRVPRLMGPILDELSTLSAISFLFIKEIVVDRAGWLHANDDVYKALVYGMIKKRPERVIKLLEASGDHFSDFRKQAVVHLVQKIRTALSTEKEEIAANGEALMLKLKQHNGKKLGFLGKVLSVSVEKRILSLKLGTATEVLDFSNEVIDNVDLSSGLFFASTIFNGCTILNSDISFSSFVNASFRGTCFHKVNLNGARFDSICFDDTVFINVSAKGATFINCSFENASFFKTSFEATQMINCIFTGALISTSLFLKTDLSGSTFACTRTANVSFADSNLQNSDFSGIQARFTRFPSYTVVLLESEFADFNARSFMFDKKDLPDSLFDPAVSEPYLLDELDLLLLTDLVHSGKKMFLKQNKFSLLTAFDLFDPKQADLFEIVPLLLHENIDFPGFDADRENTPCGISGYCPTRQTGVSAAPHVDPEKILYRFDFSPHVEGLFTIGSIGTIAQSPDSDIDYWVCVRDHDHKSPEGVSFQNKLTRLEQWAQDYFKTEIHFFIVDIDRARNDDFGDSTTESSGSAQGRILKEEFYRTMIHVAGKLPLWCTLPVSISRPYYQRLHDRICSNPVMCRFIDLGDIHEIPSEEYFGASIWQLFKWLKSPFKSVIKMALLEEFINASGKKQLLCNRFKDEWMNSGPRPVLGKIDPYYTLITSLVDYYREEDYPEAAKLVQLCFFLKTGISKDEDLDRTLFGFRAVFITRCMEEWAWNRTKVFEVGSFREWSYAKVTRLSLLVERYMLKTYKRVNQALEGGKRSMITPEDRTILGRKMFVEFSRQDEKKVAKILLVSRSDRLFKGLVLQYVSKPGFKNVWELVHRSGREKSERLKRAKSIEEVAAWFIQNRLFSTTTIINLVPNPTPVSSDDVRRLFHALYTFYRHDNADSISFGSLLAKATIKAVFISLNLCVPRRSKRIHEFSIIHLNSWGEMFCSRVASEEGFASVDDVLAQVKIELAMAELPERILLHFPKPFSL